MILFFNKYKKSFKKMSLMKVVAGNTIFIKWVIQKNSSITIENPKILLVDVFRKQCKFEYDVNVSDNKIEITGTYQGKFQKTMGKYSLVFFNNYQENNQNKLVYKDAFILVHALKNKLSSYDEIIDDSVLVEIESDLSVALMNQEITDREEIIQSLSNMTLVNDSQNQLLNDISTHLDSSISDLMNRIENISVGDFSQLIGEIEDNEEAITRYLSIIDNSVYLQKMQLFDNSTLIGEVSTRLLYLNNLHVTPLENNVTDISTNLIDLSTYTHNITIPSEYDDNEIKGRIADVSTKLTDLSTYIDNFNPGSDYDDSVLKGRIADISTYAINTSSRLNDLSTFAHNITPGSDYDDSELTNKLNDLSTYTHNLVIPNEYDDSVLKNRIADVSSKLIDLSVYVDNYDFTYFDTQITNQQVRIEDVSLYAIDLSTRLNDVSVRLSQSGGGSGEDSNIDRYQEQDYTSLWFVNSSLCDTSYVQFRDIIVYITGISTYTTEENGTIYLRNMVTGSTETESISLIGNNAGTAQYRCKIKVNNIDNRYINTTLGTPLNTIIDSSKWKNITDLQNAYYFRFPQPMRISGFSNSNIKNAASHIDTISFRFEN